MSITNRKTIQSSLQVKMTLWTGAILTILSIVILAYSILTSRQAAIASAQAEALAISEAQAGNVKSQIDPALSTARTMASNLKATKDPTDPIPLTREQVNGMLRKVAEENPAFLGTWTIWEPNAFDRQDAQYVNAPLHDATGRFIPYWVRVNDTVEGVPLLDYETPTPGLNDWYFIPRETKQETLIAPYFYPIDGVDVLMTTVSVPIVENDRFYGVTGVDYRMDFVQGLVDDINLYNGTASAVLFTDTGTLVAVRNQPELTLQPATSIFEDLDQIQARIDTGETFVSISPDGQFLRVFAPINIGEAGSRWSFSLIIPFSAITAQATASALQQTAIGVGLIMLALIILWFLTGQIVRPIRELTQVANAVSQGNLNVIADVQARDETGVLANAFNLMITQLRESFATLEQRVADRTRNLELASEVGRSISQVRALDVMLTDAAEIIRSRFDLYYAQVYLTNPSQTYLDLQAGTGNVGKELLARNHRLPFNTGSINGRAAVEKKSVVIPDTTASSAFKSNPLLPNTRSEMAVPLLIGDKVVGVLDMQSAQAGALNEETLSAFEALAGQLAIAIQNASFLAETQQARAEVEAQARRLSRANWVDYLDAIHKPEETGFVFERNQVTALNQEEPIKEDALVASISVTGEALGNLIVEMEGQSPIARTSELVNTVARQMAQQIESLRLLDSAERYRSEAEQASRRNTREGWKEYMDANTGESLSYVYDLKEVRLFNKNKDQQADESALNLPLKVRDETVGRLVVQGISSDDKDSMNLANAVAERLGAHIESLRQSEETQRGQVELDKRAQQLAAVAEISTASSKELDINKMLASVASLSQRQFGLYHAHIFTYNENTQQLEISACGWEAGSQHEGTHEKTVIALSQEQSLVARAARTKQAVIVNDVQHAEGWLPNPLLPDTASEMAVPLIVGDQVLGVIDVQSNIVNAFTEEDANIQTTLASQVATALQNARSFAKAQRQAERETTLNLISQKIQSATTVEAVLQIAARELGHTLGAPLTIAQLGKQDRTNGNGNKN